MKSNVYLKPLLILLPILLVCSAAYYWLKSPNNQFSGRAAEPVANIDSLIGTSFIDIKGQSFEVQSADEIIYIVHFWASWCAPCVHEFPQLIELSNQMNGKIVIMAISGDSNQQEIDVFLKSFPEARTAKNFHVVWDSDKQFLKRWNVNKLPESYIYNQDKKMVKRISGAIDWTTEDAKSYFQAMLVK
jgi:cytochrome c biogenesis protein CcmG/thiol:disulfide interchange protein DsbE